MTDEASDYQLQRRIDQVDAKIDAVDAKVVASARETKTGLDTLTKILDERWRSMEQKADMTGRQYQQSLDLLTSTAARQEQTISSVNTQVDMIAHAVDVDRAKLDDQKHQADAIHVALRKDIDHVLDLMKWTSRAVYGAIITGVVGFVLYRVAHGSSAV